MNKYKVTAQGQGRLVFHVEAENDDDAIRQATLEFEETDSDLLEVYSWRVEQEEEPEGVIPVVEMAALVPPIASDFLKVRTWLGYHPPQNGEGIISQITRVLDYAERAMPINLSDEAREYFELQKGDYITYWGAFEDDDTTIETIDGDTVTLPEDWIDKGLIVLAGLHYHRLSDLLSGDYDSETLDALVQAAVFGELRYG